MLNAISTLNRNRITAEPYLMKHGFEPASLCASDYFHPFYQFRDFYTSIRLEESIPDLGLMLGSEIDFTVHGMAGFAVISQQTLFESVKLMKLLFQYRLPVLKVIFVESEHYFGLRFEEMVPLDDSYSLFVELVLSSVNNIDNFMFPNVKGSSVKGSSVERSQFRLSYSEPSYKNKYVSSLSENVLFDCEHCEYLIPKERKLNTSRFYDPVSSELFLKYFLSEIPQENKINIIQQVTAVLESEEGMLADQWTVAKHLDISARTLRRKLNESGVSYQDIAYLIKKKKAIDYLLNSNLSIAKISNVLGFSDASGFTKSFKTWLGVTPSQYRTGKLPTINSTKKMMLVECEVVA